MTKVAVAEQGSGGCAGKDDWVAVVFGAAAFSGLEPELPYQPNANLG